MLAGLTRITCLKVGARNENVCMHEDWTETWPSPAVMSSQNFQPPLPPIRSRTMENLEEKARLRASQYQSGEQDFITIARRDKAESDIENQRLHEEDDRVQAWAKKIDTLITFFQYIWRCMRCIF